MGVKSLLLTKFECQTQPVNPKDLTLFVFQIKLRVIHE
jgi:hypothetical protein